MANTTTLGEAQIPIRATLDKLEKDMAGAKSKVQSAISGLQKVGTVALTGIAAGATAAVAAGAAAIAAAAKWTIDAAPVEGLSQAFDGLAESAGVGADDMLAALQRGSAGMIAQRDLMQSFNKAAQLVSTDFAVQLPDAMQYLSKVSAATGQDMDYLVDSLVTGVGRLSPMILDNLAIQVSLAEATSKAAEMFGVEEGELSKAQIQAGMMNVTLEKLATNTASMPDITETASAKMAQFRAQIQDAKDRIGLAFLPVLKSVMNGLSRLAERVMPVVMQAVDAIAPVVEAVVESFYHFFNLLDHGYTPVEAIKKILSEFFPDETVNKIMGVIDQVRAFVSSVQEAISPIITWISENVKLQDVLIGLAVAIASVIVPVVGVVVGAVGEIVLIFAAVVAAAALLRSAWESDFLGIRTALTEAWEGTIKPALQTLWQWLQTNIPAAIQALSEWWSGTLVPAMQAVWAFIQANIIPIFVTVAEIIRTAVAAEVQFLSNLWQNVLLPALTVVWDFLSGSLFPLFMAVAEFLGAVFGVAITALAGLWENVLAPAIKTVYEWLADKIKPILDTLIPIIQTAAEWIGGQLTSAFDSVAKAIEAVVGWIGEMTEKIKNIKLPDWLTPGSPTPFELGLRGIGDALQDLNRMHLPQFRMGLDISETAMLRAEDAGNRGQPDLAAILAALQPNQISVDINDRSTGAEFLEIVRTM